MNIFNEETSLEGDGPQIAGVRNKLPLIENVPFTNQHYQKIMRIGKDFSESRGKSNLGREDLFNLGAIINAAYPFTNKVEGGGNLGLQIEQPNTQHIDCQLPSAIFASSCKQLGFATRILFPSYNHDHPYIEVITPSETLYGSFRRGKREGESSFFEFLDTERTNQIITMIKHNRVTIISVSEDGLKKMDTLIN